jgi:ATP-dependent protease HslVU (ClpYQ) peptidase subunit
MTCVVGVKHNGSVFLGADSAGTDEYDTQLPWLPKKVWRERGFVFGGSGSYRAIQLVRHYLDYSDLERKHQETENTEAFMVKEMVPAVKQVFEDHGFSKKSDEVSSQDGDFLIGVGSDLYTLQDDYATLEVAGLFYAIGSGYTYALGALDIITQNLTQNFDTQTFDPNSEVLRKALQASARFCTTVNEPYVFADNGGVT